MVRRTAGLLGLHDDALEDALEDALAQIVVRGKRLALGRGFAAGSVVERTLGGRQVAAILEAHADDDPRERALTLEFVLLLAMLIKAEPSLFTGTLTLRPAQSLPEIAMNPSIEMFFSYGSTYSYLSVMRADELAAEDG